MLWLLACVTPYDPPQATTDAGHPQHQAEGPDPNALTPLELPEELPFAARTRTLPCTLVDKHGAPLEVLTAVGVPVEVKRLLATRALVTCTGCSSPIEGWVQRQALYVGDTVGDGPHDALLSGLAPDAAPAGLMETEDGWLPAEPHGELK
jgi:hypothetical protein